MKKWMKIGMPTQIGLALLIVTALGCKKDPALRQNDEEPAYHAGDYTTVNMRIVAPDGSNLDLTKAKVYSSNIPLEVGADGSAEVVSLPGYHTAAFVFDRQDNLVLAGFVTDTASVLSAATTAEVLMYYGLGIPFLPEEVADLYINGADKLPFMADFKKAIAELYKKDNQLLNTGSFAEVLARTVSDFQATAEAQSARTGNAGKKDRIAATQRVADLFIDGDIKSGLQVAQSGLGSFTITNTYRRRAHAFIYKTDYKDLAGQSVNILQSIGGDVKATKDIAIGSTAGITGFLSVILAYIADKDSEFAATTTEAAELPLLESESEATYRVKVIGPGSESPGAKTQDEISAGVRLQLETMAFDFVIPLISDIIGLKDFVKKKDLFAEDDGGNIWEEVLNKTATFIGMVPAAKAEMDKGRYDLATKELFWALGNKIAEDQANDMMQAITKTLMDRVKNAAIPGADKLDDVLMNSQLTRKIKIMQALDFIMKAVDYGRLIHDISTSKSVENWEVIALPVEVNLEPGSSVISVLEQIKLTANLKTTVADAEVVAYEWKTTGKYGYLWDDRGHKGNEFTSSIKDVYYLSDAMASDLSAGDNWEYIYVKAYLGDKLIGTDSARINVKQSLYEMKPDNVTLTGRKRGSNNNVNQNEVRLHLEAIDPNSSAAIAPNSEREYKVVWTTAGKHGGLYGRENTTPATTLTTYDDNSIWYECTDDQTLSATENITAQIYSRAKNTDEEFMLFNVATGMVYIDNDPKKIILHMPVTCQHGDTTYNEGKSMTCMITSFVSFEGEEDASSYSVRFYDVRWPNTYFWYAGSRQPSQVSGYVFKPAAGSFAVAYGSSWAVGAPSQITEHFSCGSGSGGMAQITITLK